MPNEWHNCSILFKYLFISVLCVLWLLDSVRKRTLIVLWRTVL